jgi:hypothetical protein
VVRLLLSQLEDLKLTVPLYLYIFKIKLLIMKEFRKNEQGLFICEECERTFIKKDGLSKHINLIHSIKEYYDKWLKKDGEKFCKICGKETKFTGFKRGYKNSCSKHCISEIRKQTCLKKYGVEHSWQSEILKEKSKETKIQKYGDENFVNVEKVKKTKLERYGNENYTNREKAKETCLEKYGVENPSQNNEIKNKKKNLFKKL